MYLALATGHGNVDETASVKNTLVGATLGVLLLLLRLDLDAKMSLKKTGRMYGHRKSCIEWRWLKIEENSP